MRELWRVFNFFSFIESPSFEFIIKNFKVFSCLRMHASFNLFLMLLLFCFLKLLLLSEQFLVPVMTGFSKSKCSLSGKPTSNHTLNVKCGLLTLLYPHCRREITTWEDNFVITSVNENAWLFHLAPLLSHHVSWLSLLLVSLNLSLILIRMVVNNLVCLWECMVISDSWSIISVTSEVGLGPLLLFNFNSYNFDLVVWESNFNFELGWHNKLISLNWVVVILLLLLLLLIHVLILVHVSLHLILLLLHLLS